MRKLIKADLRGILELTPVYQPTDPASIEADAAKLSAGEQADYLFLARREKSWLFDLPSVYTAGSYANLCALAYQDRAWWPVLVLLLHVDKIVEGRPWGSVTLLDYRTAARDIAIFSPLPQAQRDRHIQLILKRRDRQARYCTILDVIRYLKTGR